MKIITPVNIMYWNARDLMELRASPAVRERVWDAMDLEETDLITEYLKYHCRNREDE